MEIYFIKQVFIKWRATLHVFKLIFYKPFIENKQHVHIMGNTNINARILLYKAGQKRKNTTNNSINNNNTTCIVKLYRYHNPDLDIWRKNTVIIIVAIVIVVVVIGNAIVVWVWVIVVIFVNVIAIIIITKASQ